MSAADLRRQLAQAHAARVNCAPIDRDYWDAKIAQLNKELVTAAWGIVGDSMRAPAAARGGRHACA